MNPAQLGGFETFWTDNSRILKSPDFRRASERMDFPSQWISYPNGSPIPMDFLSQWSPISMDFLSKWISHPKGSPISMDFLLKWISHPKAFIGVVMSGFLWNLFLRISCWFFWGVGISVFFCFFKKQSKNHLTWREFPGFANRDGSTGPV